MKTDKRYSTAQASYQFKKLKTIVHDKKLKKSSPTNRRLSENPLLQQKFRVISLNDTRRNQHEPCMIVYIERRV
jgi:hypothetical protein